MGTADTIVDIAQELLQRGGFQAFSFRDIAIRLGIRAASIHYHFPTKTRLAEVVVARVASSMAGALADIAQCNISPREQLLRAAELFAGSYGDGDRLCPMCVLAMGQDTVPAGVRMGVRQFWTDTEHWLESVLSEGQGNGTFRTDFAPVTASRALLAAFEGAMVAARAMGDVTRLTDTTRFLIDSLAPCCNTARHTP